MGPDWNRVRKAALPLIAFAVIAGAHAEEMSGVWKGPWYLGMSSGVAILRLEGDTTTLQLTNNENFGAEPIPLKDLVADGKELRFRAVGEDGTVMSATLPVREDGAIRGSVKFGGYRLRLELSKPRPEAAR